MTDPIVDKIPESALRDFASDEGTARLSVIVEVEVPSLQVEVRESSRGDRKPKGPSRVVPRTADAQGELDRAMATAGEFLEDLVGASVTCLRSAHAFVLSVDPAHLRAIVAAPFTRRVRLNQTRSM